MLQTDSKIGLVGFALFAAVAVLHPLPLTAAQSECQSRASSADVDAVDGMLEALREGRLSELDAARALSQVPDAVDALIDVLVRGTRRTRHPGRAVDSTRLSAAERGVLVDALGRSAWHDVRAALELR